MNWNIEIQQAIHQDIAGMIAKYLIKNPKILQKSKFEQNENKTNKFGKLYMIRPRYGVKVENVTRQKTTMVARHALKEVRSGSSKVPSHWKKVKITPETTVGLDLEELQMNMQMMESLAKTNFIKNLQKENQMQQIKLHETLERTISTLPESYKQKMQSEPIRATSSLPLTQLIKRHGKNYKVSHKEPSTTRGLFN